MSATPKFKCYTIPEIMALCEEAEERDGVRNIKIDRRAKALDLRFDGRHYEIELARISTPEQLISWIVHLAEKNWMNAHRIQSLILATCAHWGWDAYGGKMGGTKNGCR